MKIVIIGAGLTGLYLASMLKKINVDFEIYEKSSRPGGRVKTVNIFNTNIECGSDLIQPHHFNVINLLKSLRIKSEIINGRKLLSLTDKLSENSFNQLLTKILNAYKQTNPPPSNMSAYIYFQSLLTNTEFIFFKSHIFMEELLQNEISDYMKFLFFDLKLTNHFKCLDKIPDKFNCTANQFIKINQGSQLITDKLASFVQEKLNLNHLVQEITYMPLTNSYLLMINDSYISANKVIIATNASFQNIRLHLPKPILKSIFNTKSIESMKIFTLHEKSIYDKIKPNDIIQTQSIFTNICPVSTNVLSMSYINGSKANLLYELLSNPKSEKNKTIQILNKLLTNISGINFSPIVDYAFCHWSNGYHINTKPVQTNFWSDYNLILAGEWIHPYHNTLEGSCISAIETFNIISKPLFVDKLKHKPDKF
jgi:protoporphyrinogen oxidase